MTHRGQSLKILVVDDHVPLLNLYHQVLSRWGHQVETVTSGTAAVTRVEHAAVSYDLVITDLAMPGMDGFTLRERLENIDHTLPVIAISSWVDHPDYANQVHEMFTEALVKPFQFEELRAVISAVGD